jgi:hypothetical protein
MGSNPDPLLSLIRKDALPPGHVLVVDELDAISKGVFVALKECNLGSGLP